LIIFAILGALHYWLPKMSGRMLSESLGKWTFWLMTIGYNLTFMTQYFLGFAGMPRRVFTYPDLPGWTWMNLISSIGAIFMSAAAISFVWNMATSLLHGMPAGDNPWKAWTLEWATTSPPAQENFHELPPIRSRRPLWDDANPSRPDPLVGVQGRIDSAVPEKNKAVVITFIASESGFFAVLILAYLFYNSHPQVGPGAHSLNLFKTGIYSICLFLSSFTIWRSQAALGIGRNSAMWMWLLATILLGATFLIGQGLEYWHLFQSGVNVNSNLFATTFFTLTGFHGLHVCIGLVALLIILGLAMAGDFAGGRSSALHAVGIYWHFVDAIWALVLTVIYILPHLA
jgi:heme/copper-type cytochrome/quinol oxidase subunit 3